MKVLYVNYRTNREGETDEFTDYNILTMVVSALKMRYFGYHTKFYCDAFTFRRINELHLSHVWDEIDGRSLSKAIDPNKFDTLHCFNIAKFFALSMEPAPVMLMDIDLILWKNQALLFKQSAAVFTHWESVKPVSEWYAKKNALSVPYGYQYPKTWDFRLKATNTSVIYFRDEKVKALFCEEAFRFLKNNYFSPQKTIHPEIYFVEQRMFLMVLNEMGLLYETNPIKDIIWSPAKGCFTKTGRSPYWIYYLPEKEQTVTHTWIAKSEIGKNQKFRNYYCCRLLEEIRCLSLETYQTLAGNPMFHNYIYLLQRYGSVEEVLKKQKGSTVLYNNTN